MSDVFFHFFNRESNGRAYEAEPAKKTRRARGSGVSRVLISLAVTAVFGAVYFYFKLPAINLHDKSFYTFALALCVVWTVCMVFLRGSRPAGTGFVKYNLKTLPTVWIAAVLIAVSIIGGASGWVIFRAKAYSGLLKTEDGDFAREVAEISWDQIPMLDSTSANNLANRKLGELSDLVSQFTVDSSSAQINFNGRPVRVIYLNYGSVFKWWNNRADGIPAYMVVDMVTQEVSVVRLDEGMKYSPSEFFNRNLERHLRLKYPFKMFEDVNFEIDEAGTPWWVASVVEKKIGLFGGRDIVGAVLVNAVTGETRYCEVGDVPSWVDRVYSAELLIEQYDYYGVYHNGFWNSLFGQKGCTETTDGYNYIAQDDDVWLYTGITSVSGDRGNIGFVLVNQRTKEARYYSCAGAEEYSAMSSAEGAVQQYEYAATFPLLLNIEEQPTYFMALKDAAGLVKMYALVNVQQYQIVAVGSSVSECIRSYEAQLLHSGIVSGADVPSATHELSGTVEEIRSNVIDGNTCYYIRISGSDAFFSVYAKTCPEAVTLDPGDRVTVTYSESPDAIVSAETLVIG